MMGTHQRMHSQTSLLILWGQIPKQKQGHKLSIRMQVRITIKSENFIEEKILFKKKPSLQI